MSRDRDPGKGAPRVYAGTPDEEQATHNGAPTSNGKPHTSNGEATIRGWIAADGYAAPPTRWLCLGWIPLAGVSVLVGDEGIGKSLFWVLIVAHVTTGRALPAVGLPSRKPANVAVIITEDTRTEVEERLRLAGADLSRVIFVAEDEALTGTPLFPEHMPIVQELVTKHHVVLVVADAWLDTVPGRLRIKDPQQAREALHPWREMTAATGAAALLLSHTNRLGGENSLRDRIGGTAALRQKARMLLHAAVETDDDVGTALYIGPDKANNAARKNAVRFECEIHQVREPTPDDPGTVALLVPAGDQGVTIGRLITQWWETQQADRRAALRGPSAAERAAEWLRDYLDAAEDRTAPQSVVVAAGSAARPRHTERALRDALTLIGGVSAPSGPGMPWWWSMRPR